MLNKLINLLKYYSTHGVDLPMAYDKDKQGPSITMFFAYLANLLALVSIITLLIKDPVSGTISSLLYAVIMMVLYIMRKITKFKVDLDDKNIELDSGEESNEKS